MHSIKIKNLKFKILHDESGQSLIEIIVGLAIGAMLIGAASFAISQTLQSNISIQKAGSAVNMSQELLSKARAYGLANWQNLYGLTKASSTQYYINASGTTYLVIQGKEGLLDNDVTNGLVGEWKLDEYEGTTSTITYDSIGSSNGTLANTPIRATSTCKIGNCLSFDGVNDYVNVSDNSVLDFSTSPFSVSFWLYVNNSLASNTEYGLVNKNVTYQGSAGWGLEISTWSVAAGKFNVANYITTQTTWGNTNVYKNSLDVNTWYHVVGIRNSTTTYIYVNGTLGSSKSHADGAGNVDNAQPIVIGDNSWGPNFPGYIDDVRVYNRALSADEVGQIYKSATFTRYFYVENTCRTNDASSSVSGVAPCGSITPASSDDPSTQKITSVTEWPTKASTGQVSFSDYITRSRNVIFQQTDWSGGTSGGVVTSPQSTFTSSTNLDSSGGSIRIQGL
ncbi:MAG: LamG-like jellyroll fold domain-containing protein [Candidatus Paceibacterota bacterium]|jgi:type II secretory pathway pseudopilin PulG